MVEKLWKAGAFWFGFLDGTFGVHDIVNDANEQVLAHNILQFYYWTRYPIDPWRNGKALATAIANIAKGTTDPRVEFCLPKSQVLTQILIKFQNSKSQPNFNFKILTKQPLHNISKPQQQNTDQTSVSKFRLNFNFKLLTKPCAESLNIS